VFFPSLETIARLASVISCLTAVLTLCISHGRWIAEKAAQLMDLACQAIGNALVRCGQRLLRQRRER
jgi:hypothetical protein